MMRGWFQERYRHSLAAKGIPTGRRYLAEKERNVIQEFMAAPTTDDIEAHRASMLGKVRGEVSTELDRAIAEERITSDDALRFWRDDYETEKELFMNNGQSYEQFRANVGRKLQSHLRMRKKGGLDIFDWAKKGEEGC